MKLTALVENTTHRALRTVHGLSLYIETAAHRLLFDVGPDDTLFANSTALGADLAAVDTVIISHGHFDHGGALAAFLAQNHTAKVYVQRRAFEPHYSLHSDGQLAPIGLDAALRSHPQVTLLDGDADLDDTLHLFVVPDTSRCHSPANDTLFGPNGPDDFLHEQNLMIRGAAPVLVLGCGHTGIVNILQKAAPWHPAVCIGGYHLASPHNANAAPPALLGQIGDELAAFPAQFYTCHCTGEAAFAALAQKANNLHYLACGDSVLV